MTIVSILKGSVLNPELKGYCVIQQCGKHKGRIIIDGITKKQAKSLCVVIEKKGLPFDD